MVIRSLLYAPGNEPRKVQKVGTFGADAVILDLEDAVPIQEKVPTRAAVRQAIPSVKATGSRVFVRVNPVVPKAEYSMDFGLADIEAVVCAELDGVLVPKVESGRELIEIDGLLAERERSLGLAEGSLEVIPIIETALGVWNAYDIARRSSRIRSLHFGAGDFTRDLGSEWSRDEPELLYARSRLLLISRSAGIGPPTDSVWARLDDGDGFAASVRRAKDMGFQGETCIHPRQVEVVNRIFSHVSPEELAHAGRVVAAFDDAQARGSAAIVVDGQFVDYPLVERARRILQLHAETPNGAQR